MAWELLQRGLENRGFIGIPSGAGGGGPVGGGDGRCGNGNIETFVAFAGCNREIAIILLRKS